MNFFENMLNMKTKLIGFLQDRDEAVDKKIKAFNDFWKMFTKFALKLVKFNPNDTNETWNLEGITRSQTPNPLVLKSSEPCVKKTNSRCRSTAPSEGRSETDKSRRLFRKKWTRCKGEQKSRALSKSYPGNAYISDYEESCYSVGDRRRSFSRSPSSFSYSVSRPSSPDGSAISISALSIDTSLSGQSRSSSKRKKRKVDGKPLRTRSVSRSENIQANMMLAKESNKFYCSDWNCDLFFTNVDKLAAHKVIDHGMVPRFSCGQCWKVYTTREELEIHSKVHDAYTVMCFQCGAEFKGSKNLQEHLKNHQEYSINCRYCNFSFLSKEELKQHCSRQHQKKQNRKVHTKKSTVLKKFNYKVTATSVNNRDNQQEKNLETRILLTRTPAPATSVTNPTNNVRNTVSSSQIPSAITISDISSVEVPDPSPITISDISSVITFKEVPSYSSGSTLNNQRSTIVENEICDTSSEVQIVLNDETVNEDITQEINNVECNIDREQISFVQKNQIVDKISIPKQPMSVLPEKLKL
ncbi:hypothetical protein WA026_009579 [Henosepilachna vigintioctopunctata]